MNPTLLRAAVVTALALGTLTACATTEPVSAARLAVTSDAPEPAASTTTTPPPATTAQPPALNAPGAARPSPTPAKPTASAPPPSTAASAAPSLTPGPDRLAVTTDPKLGAIVTDATGMTLYRLDVDTPPKVNCVNDCARRFPPLLAPAGDIRGSGGIQTQGIDPKLIATVIRPDRTVQVTLAGRPLYRFAGDRTPGDTLGHNLAGAFAIRPTGAKAS